MASFAATRARRRRLPQRPNVPEYRLQRVPGSTGLQILP